MKSILLSAISIIVIFFALESAHASNSCKDLRSELQLLRKAQNQIILGLANNHVEMANSLNQVSSDLRFSNKAPSVKVVNGLNQTARAYHRRGLKAREQAQTLDEATADLINRISACLR